jgi:hypothetical protein
MRKIEGAIMHDVEERQASSQRRNNTDDIHLSYMRDSIAQLLVYKQTNKHRGS